MDEQNNYPLTLEHVKRYLATKQDDEPVGLCLNSMACLLTETLNYVYPEMKPWRVDIGSYSAHDMARSIYLDDDQDRSIRHVASIFDHGNTCKFSEPITKKMFRAMVLDSRRPFALSELFPEEQPG